MLRIVALLAAFVSGCALQLQQAQLLAAWIYASFCLPALVWIAYCAIKLRVFQAQGTGLHAWPALCLWLTLHALVAAALGFGLTGWRAQAYQSQALLAVLEGQDIRVTGVIAAMPQRDASGLRFRFDVESAVGMNGDASTPVALPKRLQLSWYRWPVLEQDAGQAPWAQLSANTSVQAGERWQMTVRLKAPHGNLNPHGFDYELWLWEQGIGATGYVRASPLQASRGQAPVKIGATWRHPLEAARQAVRDAIFQRINDPALAGVIAALSVGDQTAIERADWDVYRATGVAHLMSISGLHITMFAWAFALLIGQLWRRSLRLSNLLAAQNAALLGGLSLALLYALFSGWGLPAQRTAGMLALVSVLKLCGKRWPWPLMWLGMLSLIVALDPWALLSAGFWLSFVAVGVLFASDAGRALPHSASLALVQRAARLLREQWVITLALAPLTLLLFNQVSVVGLGANVLAIPWVTLIVTPLALGGALFAPLWDVAAVGITWLGQVLGVLEELPFATFSVASSPVLVWSIALLGGVFGVMRLPLALRLAGLLMLVPLLLHSPPRPPQAEFAVLAADIGQGNALLIQTANHSLLYDAGPRFSSESDAGQRTLVPLLRALGERLDTVVISHRDADHIGGAAAVLSMQPQAKLISSIEAQHELQALRPSQRCTAGQHWQWDGVDFEILHPSAADYERTQKPNAMSCVLRVSNGRQTLLLTGDIEAAQEQSLVAAGANLKADLMLVPHHGSKTSSTAPFIEAVQPRIAWVQAGYRNRFQHPVAEVVQRYEQRTIRIVRSDRCGAARWQSLLPDTVLCQREVAQRYWHHSF